MLMAAAPTKKSMCESVLPEPTCANRTSRYPTRKLNSPHSTLTKGDESPLPGGFENGEGNLLPETPCTKCGTAFARNSPAKKLARYRYHVMSI